MHNFPQVLHTEHTKIWHQLFPSYFIPSRNSVVYSQIIDFWSLINLNIYWFIPDRHCWPLEAVSQNLFLSSSFSFILNLTKFLCCFLLSSFEQHLHFIFLLNHQWTSFTLLFNYMYKCLFTWSGKEQRRAKYTASLSSLTWLFSWFISRLLMHSVNQFQLGSPNQSLRAQLNYLSKFPLDISANRSTTAVLESYIL